MVQAAIKNRDIEARTGGAPADDDALVIEVLQKMIKQRRESAEAYRKGGRDDRAQAEEAEIAVIERFLPKQMSEDEARDAIAAIIADTGASSIKDMGKGDGRGEGPPFRRAGARPRQRPRQGHADGLTARACG
jgi:uncharacterized protein